jgi:hypothetical protein
MLNKKSIPVIITESRVRFADIFCYTTLLPRIWQYGLWSFQTKVTKLKRFLPKNQHTQRKLLNFEFWINGCLASKALCFLSNEI